MGLGVGALGMILGKRPNRRLALGNHLQFEVLEEMAINLSRQRRGYREKMKLDTTFFSGIPCAIGTDSSQEFNS